MQWFTMIQYETGVLRSVLNYLKVLEEIVLRTLLQMEAGSLLASVVIVVDAWLV